MSGTSMVRYWHIAASAARDLAGSLLSMLGVGVFVLFLGLLVAGVQAQDAQAPAENEDSREVDRPKPDFGDLQAIRFLTDSDYPPFNYLDEEGSLSGFNVDLARALCDELAVECDLRTTEWAELIPTVERGDADALVASIRTGGSTLQRLDFTDSYYRTPARFVARTVSELKELTPEALAGRTIAVVEKTGHEAFLRDFFPQSQIKLFGHDREARAALKKGEVDLLFGDGITLMFWINGTTSESCCEFRGGPYYESRYFGEGVGIAVSKGNRTLRAILDYGLARLRATGRLDELYLRYFPLSVF